MILTVSVRTVTLIECVSDRLRPSRVTVSETVTLPDAGKVSVGLATVVELNEPVEVDHA